MKKNELSYRELKNYCNPNIFKFETTEELNDSDLIYGQDRGIKALEFGVGIDIKGYNLYLEGPSGVGKTAIVESLAQLIVSSSAPRNLKNKIGFGSTEFHVLRPIENISNSEWIYRLTTFKSFRKDAENNMTGSAGQRRTPKEFFDKYKVGLPPLSLQNDFAAFVQQIDKSKFVVKQQIKDLQELMDSKMQEYFGE